MAGKVETYLGFCLRARKITLGTGSIDTLKSGVSLIVVCSTASDNAFKLAQKYAARHACPLVICKCGLENVLHREGCKMAAVRDERLAEAILKNLDGDYELYAGGND